MMRNCMDWMMSLGVFGMLVIALLLVALLVLVVVLIARAWRSMQR